MKCKIKYNSDPIQEAQSLKALLLPLWKTTPKKHKYTLADKGIGNLNVASVLYTLVLMPAVHCD